MRTSRWWLAMAVAGTSLGLPRAIARAADLPGPAPAQAAPGAAALVPPPPASPPAVTIRLDRTSLDNGGTIQVTGTAPAGKPVFIEVWSTEKVRASRFDTEKDKQTGKRPYVLYMTQEMPAFYKLFVP